MPEPPPQPSQMLEMPDRGPMSLGEWQTRIDQAKEAIRLTREKFQWATHVERYVQKYRGSIERDTIELPKDYSYTEQKKPLLFYQLPDVVLTPARPDVPQPTANLFGAVLNELVGPDQLNAKPVIDEVLTDLLVPAGIGIATIGYEVFIDPTQPETLMTVDEQPMIDPMTGQPQMDPATGQPMMQPIQEPVPNIVRERYFLTRISPIDFLYDTAFRGSDWRRCSWLGYRFRMPVLLAESLYQIDADDLKSKSRATTQPGPDDSLAPDKTVQHFGGIEGVRVWYRAADFDPGVGDPELIRTFVLLDGYDDPVEHKNSPYQKIEGAKVVGGLMGFPVYPLTLRYVSDSPIPPSDCAQSRVIVDELSRGRSQMLQQRDRNVPLRGVEIDKVSPDARAKVQTGQVQELIPLSGLNPGDNPFHAIPQSAYPQENFNFNNIGERDLQECWALSSNNLGSANVSGRTATELSIMQQGTENRMQAEQVRVVMWWVQIVQGLAALVQQFAPQTDQYVKVLGPQGAQQLMQWTQQDIQGTFAFSIRPDSAKRVDQTSERKFRLDVYQLFANDPLINQQELRRWVAPAFGFDPDKILAEPQKPEPPPPDINVTISDDGLSPLSPQYNSVVQLLASRGIQLQAPAQPGQQMTNGSGNTVPPHGGAVQPLNPVNKHLQQQTGQLPGPTNQSRPS